ncbi:hypothetical protein G3N94_20775 [Burkholderia sp. Ac-20353]|nr:hypothetical protein [Burkholderia sp. Ac-20353]
MRHIPARPEQAKIPNHLTVAAIVRDALRDAALSDRPNDAIDTLAGALLRLAVLVRAGGSYA